MRNISIKVKQILQNLHTANAFPLKLQWKHQKAVHMNCFVDSLTQSHATGLCDVFLDIGIIGHTACLLSTV